MTGPYVALAVHDARAGPVAALTTCDARAGPTTALTTGDARAGPTAVRRHFMPGRALPDGGILKAAQSNSRLQKSTIATFAAAHLYNVVQMLRVDRQLAEDRPDHHLMTT